MMLRVSFFKSRDQNHTFPLLCFQFSIKKFFYIWGLIHPHAPFKVWWALHQNMQVFEYAMNDVKHWQTKMLCHIYKQLQGYLKSVYPQFNKKWNKTMKQKLCIQLVLCWCVRLCYKWWSCQIETPSWFGLGIATMHFNTKWIYTL